MATNTSSLYQVTESGHSDHPECEVHKHVEDFLAGRVLSTTATPVVEEVLFDQALLHHLVYAGRKIAGALEKTGLSVQLQYCTSATHGHPIPFLITRNSNGELVVPTTTPRDAHCYRSTMHVLQCPNGAEKAHHTVSSGVSDTPIVVHTKGAIIVIPNSSKQVQCAKDDRKHLPAKPKAH
jgi:hypothetical protein